MASTTSFTANVAENYEKFMGPLFFVPYAKDIVSRLPGNINSVLEIACGTGQVTRLLREHFPEARIVATDLNPGMIEVAKKIIGEQDKIEWSVADAQELPVDLRSPREVPLQTSLIPAGPALEASLKKV